MYGLKESRENMTPELEKKIHQLKNLKQYKDLNDAELERLAKEELDKKNIITNLAFCMDDEEKEFATDLLNRYLSQSGFENEADRDTLKQLIDIEILLERVKKFLKTEYGKANPAIPVQMMEQLQDLITQSNDLKGRLGLTSKDATQATWINDWSKLKKKAINYFETHKGCNVVKCPYCQNLFYLLMRTENLTPEKCGWFEKTILYNHKLFELYDQKKITKEEITEVLGVSVFYIDYIFENLYLRKKDEKKE
jgi:hypothetical protein